MQTLRTARLRLEPFAPDHAHAYRDYLVRNREHLQPWEPLHDERYYTLEGAAQEIAEAIHHAQSGSLYRWLAFERIGSSVVGAMNLWDVRRMPRFRCVMGYGIDKDHQGRGYATEAAAELVRFSFDELGLHRVEATHDPANPASARVLAKLGFEIEGLARKHLLINGTWRDSVLTAKINPNWNPPC